MIDQERKAARLSKLTAAMDGAGLDAVALVPGANFYYLTGVHLHLMERPTVLFVARDGSMHGAIPTLESARWGQGAPEVNTTYWQDSDGFDDAFADVARRLKAERIGVEGQLMRVFERDALRSAFADARIDNAHAAISRMRLVKDAEEVAIIEQAIAISERALRTTIDAVVPGMSEVEIRSRLMTEMLAEGADAPAFDTIVLARGASADPHGTPSPERRLEKGDPLLIDFGAAHGGYNADITRTFFVGAVSDEHRAIYETVLAANETGRTIAAPGMTLHDLDTAVTERLRGSPFADMVLHKTGHGLGIEVHEAPQVMVGNRAPIEPGMVFTIEPGLYRSGEIGVRIEDDVLITEDGCRSLTGFERGLTVIGS
ncbi:MULTISPECIES: Xaa-Pro peptidase family protein [unclassified Roseitalea]|uniref:M24 family metallopeptidase n=1 Tax=unclassified Roseitalea TaxID=2639107 RepID=UPI00273E88DB|nr:MULTISPECIES: Xaa-Pro peptidase family protein [unclassified Roseitalea]